MKGNGEERLRGMLGFAMRAGRVIIGADLVCAAMSKRGVGRPHLVLVSASASDATKKRAFSKSEFYGIEALEIAIGQDELGRLLGKTYAPVVLGITDARFAEEIKRAVLSDPKNERDRKDVFAEGENR